MTYRPWANGRKVGIEMEMNTVTTSGATLSLAGIHAEVKRAVQSVNPSRQVVNRGGYGHTAGSFWEVKTDSSCGYEVATAAVALDAEGNNAELKAGIDALANMAPQINRSCGLHVWIDAQDFSWRDMQKLLSLWARYEPFFFELLPSNRKDNHYCRAMRKQDWTSNGQSHWNVVSRAIAAQSESAFNAFNGANYSPSGTFQKYSAMNISKWWQNGCIEFRLHSGTVNYDKIRNWVKLLVAVVERVKNTQMAAIKPISNISAETDAARANGRLQTRYMAKHLGLVVTQGVTEVPASNEQLLAWIDERRAKFAPRVRTPRATAARATTTTQF